MSDTKALFARRQRRTRYALRKAAGGRPRLSVFRSGKHIYAQVIDDREGRDPGGRLVARRGRSRASSRPAPTRTPATEVGKLIAERAIAAGVKEVVFDRGGYQYHGRVAALATAAREGGLSF